MQLGHAHDAIKMAGIFSNPSGMLGDFSLFVYIDKFPFIGVSRWPTFNMAVSRRFTVRSIDAQLLIMALTCIG